MDIDTPLQPSGSRGRREGLSALEYHELPQPNRALPASRAYMWNPCSICTAKHTPHLKAELHRLRLTFRGRYIFNPCPPEFESQTADDTMKEAVEAQDSSISAGNSVQHHEHQDLPLGFDDPHRAALEDNPDKPEKLTLSVILSALFRAVNRHPVW